MIYMIYEVLFSYFYPMFGSPQYLNFYGLMTIPSYGKQKTILVGGLEHFYFSIYWESSSQLTNIFQRG